LKAHRGIALALLAVAVPSVLAAAPPFQREVKATVEETAIPGVDGQPGGWSRKTVLPRFEFFTLWPDTSTPGEPVEVLLDSVLTSMQRTDSEGTESSIVVTAWKSGKSRYDTKLWSFTDEADGGEIFRYGELYQTVKHGCCAAEDVFKIYDLRTGRLAATSTVRPGIVEVPNTPVRRIVAYHGTAGEVPPPEAETMKRLLGVLTLSTRGEVLHRVGVVDTGEENRIEFSPALVLKVDGSDGVGDSATDVTLWVAEKNPTPSGIRGFRVELTWLDEGKGADVLRIPFENDDFDLANAKVPPTLKLVRIR
jgi:hypothetical protein